ncbi:methyltransferase-domain-containing protein [Hyaloraphidium curvatum]|nr:methyltransferase-domain-containing protein [Hyaloraphidium curvatum]
MSTPLTKLKLSAKQRSQLAKSLGRPKTGPGRAPEPSRNAASFKAGHGHAATTSLKRKRRDADSDGERGPVAEQKAARAANDSAKDTGADLPGRLRAAQFRFINEMLYTSSSSEAWAKTSQDPELLVAYHEGFRHQVEQWPTNPVDVFVDHLRDLVGRRGPKTPDGAKARERLVVADLGCGEAKIARTFDGDRRVRIHSFDLAAVNRFVTACDIARTPLEDRSVDVAIFCLSLMGTNYLDFVREAVRILKAGGRLKVAEVKSRIGSAKEFVKAIESCGVRLESMASDNKMFELFSFVKDAPNKAASRPISYPLKPCLYKKR